MSTQNNSDPSRNVLVKYNKVMLKKLDEIAEDEVRTRSELLREAARRYIQDWEQRKILNQRVRNIQNPPTTGTDRYSG